MAQNYGLGRGLSSLIPSKKKPAHQQEENKITEPKKDFNYFGSRSPFAGDDNETNLSVNNPTDKKEGGEVSSSGNIQKVSLSKIVPNPLQPRTNFDESRLYELAESIKEHGIIQPIVVSKNADKYEIVAGERRFQAAKIAGLSEVPIVVREKPNDQQKLELAIVENVQRQDLNPVEEAKSYLKLTEEFDLTQEEAAKKLGKSRSSVANKIRLLDLPVEIQKSLIEGKITEGHAKLLLSVSNPEKQRAFYEMIIKNDLTVRQTQDKAREVSVKPHKRNVAVDPEIKSAEDEISAVFGTKVKIKKSGSGGRIEIEYYSKEELNNILSKIK